MSSGRDPVVTIVDYGAGNLRSVANQFDYLGLDAVVSDDPDIVRRGDRLVLPGVGAAGYALEGLRASGLDAALGEAVKTRGAPLLCICVGLQVLARELEEFGAGSGLGWTDGRVVDLGPRSAPSESTPHMGWSTVEIADAAPDWMRRALRAPVYFCHSFGLIEATPKHVAATSDRNGGFVAALAFGSVIATQFHPEKSQVVGRDLIEGFCGWTP